MLEESSPVRFFVSLALEIFNYPLLENNYYG